MCQVNISREDELSERLFQSTIGALELFGVYLGRKLGLYRALSTQARTPAELAHAAGIHVRYAREWLEQQAVAGYLTVDDVEHAAADRKYSLPSAYTGVLVEESHAAHVAPFADMLVGIAQALPQVVEAYRSGAGVPYSAYGPDFRAGQGGINRPAFSRELLDVWLPALPQLYSRLKAGEALRIADVGCGEGWASIALAKAFPNATVVGYDLDPASIDAAHHHALLEEVNVEFLCADAAALSPPARNSTARNSTARSSTEPSASAGFDLVLLLETLHDLAKPDAVLHGLRQKLASTGVLLVADERVAERFIAPGDEIERMMYGWSISHCLPTSMSEPGSAAIGTAIRPHVVEELARAAGFARCQLLDIHNDLFRFWCLQGQAT